ncbi:MULTISPECIES: DUF4190 domain-containing protein [unclassified Modestobacter]|uniref:DUF4190 domain-containing protein n=1 Tax=unclassified Modestobacter TaxID=2643866 RepID=UPI0022AAAD80|nr:MULTISPECIES: DUF4190 domain-containing protein [unclassified Modestobacter]MCZ2823042.1 DUF4190 domain-containing protein [Modestobacter sp. VKM Ac-2981]MCZ2851288.1 DUF4190 domain-containing protein [Modestobacter sp. VKM Ac-2982]
MSQHDGSQHPGPQGYVNPSYGPPPGPPYGPPGPPYGPPGAPYGPPPYGYGYPPPPQRTNGLAIASMVLGIVWLYWIGSILALVFGYVAKKQIRERGEGGDGMATAGIVLGWVGIGVLAIPLVLGTAAGLS